MTRHIFPLMDLFTPILTYGKYFYLAFHNCKNIVSYKNHVCIILVLDSDSLLSEGQNELPESKYLRVENKVFYFDVGSNRRGVYLRISEVSIYTL